MVSEGLLSHAFNVTTCALMRVIIDHSIHNIEHWQPGAVMWYSVNLDLRYLGPRISVLGLVVANDGVSNIRVLWTDRLPGIGRGVGRLATMNVNALNDECISRAW